MNLRQTYGVYFGRIILIGEMGGKIGEESEIGNRKLEFGNWKIRNNNYGLSS
jgi:hypothetical protein